MGSTSTTEMRRCCAPRGAWRERDRRRASRPSSARTRCRRKRMATRTRYIDEVCDDMIPAVAADDLADAVDAFCEGIAFSPEQIARVFDAARGCGPAGEAARRSALQPARRRARRRATARCRPTISNTPTRTASRPWRARAPSPCCCPARSTSCARRRSRRSKLLRRHGVPMAIATDCNPGTSPLTSLLLTHEHGGDAVSA